MVNSRLQNGQKDIFVYQQETFLFSKVWGRGFRIIWVQATEARGKNSNNLLVRYRKIPIISAKK